MNSPAGTTDSRAACVGRFAPSPTGPLHFGSLVAAVGSYLQARTRGGRWLLRIEDLDPPREVPGAARAIVETLENYGFEWDGPVTWQSRRHARYEDALARLREQGRLFACSCSRKDIAAANPDGSQRYPGTCRERGLVFSRAQRHSLRLRCDAAPVIFEDRLRGQQVRDLAAENGDIVLFRRDGFYAYALAVSVDDLEQGVTEVVRGADLLEATAAQIYIMRQLGGQPPAYVHLPVVTNSRGEKLSKQTGATALPADRPAAQLYRALRFLQQNPPPELAEASLADCWRWARDNWRLQALRPGAA